MRYILDSSVAFKWAVPEINSDKALRLRDEARAGACELLTPDIFPVELAHAVTRAERVGRVAPAQGAVFLTAVLTELPTLHSSMTLLPRAYALASAARIGIYDCLYVALAEREGCPFVTAADKLARNLRSAFPYIAELSSFP